MALLALLNLFRKRSLQPSVPNTQRPTLRMAEDEKYLAVLKASYDYDPQPDAEDELAIKEDQLLFLLEKVDEE